MKDEDRMRYSLPKMREVLRCPFIIQYSFSAAIASGEVVRVSVNNGIRVAAVTQKANESLAFSPISKKSCDSLIMSLISENLQAVHQAIAQAAQRFGRNPTDIALLAVSKTFPAEDVLKAWQAGQSAFGENYVQEAVEKIAQVDALLAQQTAPDLNTETKIEWHFIGPIQSNKTRLIAEHFAWVHSIERDKIAHRLSEQRPLDLPDLNVCLQVNISGEASKSGVSPDQCLELARYVRALPRLRLRGLMAVPEATEDETQQRQAFAALRRLAEELRHDGIELDTLSMGMSADLTAAIAEGSTMVRIGSAIFGKRNNAV